ncbi:ADP-ribosylation factor-like protein 6-interacting protein 4 [Dysidea avara]|uniref:ADP-ribosylation factor-like protein 6-interacting protein 4 n=1 Tax=Dysidea avara TaxID=196820 RepID=UPI00332A6629
MDSGSSKRKRAEDDSSDSSRSSSEERLPPKKRKKHHDRKKHKKEKKKKKRSSKTTRKDKKKQSHKSPKPEDVIISQVHHVTSNSPTQRSLGPMTKEQYDKKQSTIRRVFDEDTGRHRLIRGDGEVVEEIVSKQRQQQINKAATAGDGASFQSGLTKFYHK